MKNFEQLWKELEENFEWQRVKTAMDSLNWYWVSCGGTPNIEQIIKAAKKFCLETYNISRSDNQIHRIGSGGIWATYIEYSKSNELILEFVVANYSAGED